MGQKIIRKYWEDFSIGEKFETQAITLTDAHAINWASVTMDFHPLHMSEEYAQNTVFKGRIFPGAFILSIAIGLDYMSGIYGETVIIWLGVENLRMFIPAKIGDTIHVESVLTEKKPTRNPKRGVAKFSWMVKNQRDEVVMSVCFVLMMNRQAPENFHAHQKSVLSDKPSVPDKS